MKREVIQDFLNLPGIAGVALMDGRSRPYFCGVDQTLNFQQKEALAQGILRVVETIPEGFETFEFQFTGHQVHIYKLEHGIILLVLTRSDLVYTDYLKTIKDLKVVLKEDITNAIATFRLIAGNITLSGMNYRKSASDSAPVANVATTSANTAATATSNNHQPKAPVPVAPSPPAATPAVAPPSVPVSVTDEVSLKETLSALNHLSKFTTQYLGTHVIVNYWKSTRPPQDWLNNLQIDRSAQFTFTGITAQGQQTVLTETERQWVKDWVASFTKRCSQVIRDFPNLVEQKALDEEQKRILLE